MSKGKFMQENLKISCKTKTLQEHHYTNYQYDLEGYISYNQSPKLDEIVIQYFYSLGIDYHDKKDIDKPPICNRNISITLLKKYYLDPEKEEIISPDIEYDKIKKDELPEYNPIFENEFYRIWINRKAKEKVTLPRDIARELKNYVSEYGKMSHNQKDLFIEDNFPNHSCSDKEILEQFEKIGGAYTDKYLRLRV